RPVRDQRDAGQREHPPAGAVHRAVRVPRTGDRDGAVGPAAVDVHAAPDRPRARRRHRGVVAVAVLRAPARRRVARPPPPLGRWAVRPHLHLSPGVNLAIGLIGYAVAFVLAGRVTGVVHAEDTAYLRRVLSLGFARNR